MIDISEVIHEQEKLKNDDIKQGKVQITHVSKKQQNFKRMEPSFFKKMFSTRNLNQVLPEIEEFEKEKSQITEGYNGIVNKDLNLTGVETENKDEKIINNEISDDEKKSIKLKNNVFDDSYYDPPLPNIGKPTDINRLDKRKIKAEYALRELKDIIMDDVKASIKEASDIPVSKELDRITVKDEQYERINLIKSKKDIDNSIEAKIQEIQKSLNYRKSAIIIMNSNYTSKLVRKIEPIYVSEARSILDHDVTPKSIK